MELLQVQIDFSSMATQYGILGVLALILGYFAWHTYNQVAKKNDEDYKRLVKKK